MYYLDFLAAVHERLEPRTYLEIGVAEGHSLALSRCRSIGIDPEFHVTQQIVAPVSLYRCTSDAYFADLPAPPFGALPIDLAYIDGMHHFEFALRDFIAVERHSASSSVIAFDDVLPRDVAEAAREPRPLNWTGDVFRLQFAFASHRPDLTVICVDTEPTGTMIVAHLDPGDTVLAESLDDIVRDSVQPDPQPVPTEVLQRTGAIPAQDVLASPLWDELRSRRG